MAGALVCLLLLGIAAFVFADGWLLVGLLAVASPLVLFLAGSVTTSGIEVCAGIAQAATVLTLTRRSGDHRIWLGYAVSGVALALTRQFGPIWVLADAGVAAVLLGRSEVRSAVRNGGRVAIGSLAVVGIAALTTIGWDALALPTVVPPVHVVLHQVGPALSQSYRSIPQLFGVFGWEDTKPPGFASDLAVAIYALVLLSGLALGTRRQRVVLVLAVVATEVAAVVVDAVTQLPFGFGLQVRYVMPLSAMTLLLAAWVGHERVRPGRARTGVVPKLVSAVLIGELGLAWLANSRQAAVGAVGPRLFFAHPQWSPPGGWAPWIIVAALAGLVMFLAVSWVPSNSLPRSVPASGLRAEEGDPVDDNRQLQVSRIIDAPPERIFALLADPARHRELDGADMLRGLDSGDAPITAVGQAFVMNMDQDGIGDYQMRNEIVFYEADRRIGWAPAIHPPGALAHILGELDPSGHTYAWDLEPGGNGGTKVTHTYDWSGVRDQNALDLYPRVSTDQMEGTLDRVAAAVSASGSKPAT